MLWVSVLTELDKTQGSCDVLYHDNHIHFIDDGHKTRMTLDGCGIKYQRLWRERERESEIEKDKVVQFEFSRRHRSDQDADGFTALFKTAKMNQSFGTNVCF